MLTFTQPVDRELIHRQHAGEVFLTGARRIGRDRFAAAALLPAAHPHYGAHTGAANRALDPMLLIECCRQAETYAAHAFHGVELGAHFVLRNWSAELPPVAPGAAPHELLLTARTDRPRVVGGRTRGLDYDFTLWLSGRRAGRVRMSVGYIAAAAYPALRSRRRGGPPPTSDRLPPAGAGRPVPPGRVGRVNATDTVLCDAAVGPAGAGATLRVPVENRSLFDHAQDHVPGTVLLEAGRQLAALANHAWGGGSPDATAMTAMTASFTAYAELDEPVRLAATRAAGTTPASVDVAVEQLDRTIARISLVMTDVHHPPSGDRGR